MSDKEKVKLNISDERISDFPSNEINKYNTKSKQLEL
jgi:hypothetical protein